MVNSLKIGLAELSYHYDFTKPNTDGWYLNNVPSNGEPFVLDQFNCYDLFSFAVLSFVDIKHIESF